VPERKLEDHPEDLGTLRDLLAKRLGLPTDPLRPTLWERAVQRWKPLKYAPWVVLVLGFLFLEWLSWMVFHR
jgi:hypothetical protein